jgi:putative acetyltransferase
VRFEFLNRDSSADSVEAARTLLLEYGRFVLAAEGPARFCFGRLEDEAKGLPDSYASMGGELLLAWVNGGAAGCVTYRTMGGVSGGCEMKRLWVRPGFRGLGIAERLTLQLCERARLAGFDAVYLDTMPESMGAAYRMYQRLGFVECAPFHENTAEGLVFLRRSVV